MKIAPVVEAVRQAGFEEYVITRQEKRERQRYLLRDRSESERTVESEQYEVTLYADYRAADKKYRGSYFFILKPGEDLKAYLEAAEVGIRLVKNRPYELVAPEAYPVVETFDERCRKYGEVFDDLGGIIARTANADGVRLSSAELYLTETATELYTSTGIDAGKKKTTITVDVTLLSADREPGAETHFHCTRRRVGDLALERRIDSHRVYVRDMAHVEVPPSGPATVVMPLDDVYALFSPLIFHTSARARDFGVNRIRLGDALEGCERLSIISDGLIPYGLFSGAFDEEGIKGQVSAVIENGRFGKYWATKQYADYVGVDPTGAFRNLVLKTAAPQDIGTDDFVRIVQFSDFSIDAMTGDFVSEIRFGYHHQGPAVKPIKGGSVSGNLFRALPQMILGGATVFEGNYSGPSLVAFRGLTVAGR